MVRMGRRSITVTASPGRVRSEAPRPVRPSSRLLVAVVGVVMSTQMADSRAARPVVWPEASTASGPMAGTLPSRGMGIGTATSRNGVSTGAGTPNRGKGRRLVRQHRWTSSLSAVRPQATASTRTDVPYDEAVPVDALTWRLDPHPSGVRALTVELMCRPARLPLPLLGHQSSMLVPFTRLRTLIPASLEAARAVGPDGVPVDPAHVGVMAWLQAAWTLMSTPSLTQTTVVAGTGKPRTSRPSDAAGRGHGANDDGVTVIDLHPQRRRLITDEADGGGDSPRRRLTSRHVVRGHWTHQPHGPQRSLRRLQWVDDYIRGPQDAPLSTRVHIWAWRHQ